MESSTLVLKGNNESIEFSLTLSHIRVTLFNKTQVIVDNLFIFKIEKSLYLSPPNSSLPCRFCYRINIAEKEASNID